MLQRPGTCRNEHAVPFKIIHKRGQRIWEEVADKLGRSVYGRSTWTDAAVAVGLVTYRVAVLSGMDVVDLGTVVINGYTLAVTGGTGSGSDAAGTVVEISAAPIPEKTHDFTPEKAI